MIPSQSTLLVAVDLSAASRRTLRYVLDCIRDNEAKMHILHVCEPMSDDAKLTLMMFMQDAKQRQNAVSQRKTLTQTKFTDYLEDFWAEQPEADRKLFRRTISAEVIEGFPAEIILQQAKKHACDMIVLGAHEQGINHTFLGTVTKRVLRRADIPTLVVPSRDS